jgi:hypothetical protein
MARPKLTPQQRAAILRRLAAKVSYADVAAEFGCTIDNVKYYASKEKPKIRAAKESRDSAEINRGLSEVDARVAQLEWLNGLLQSDLQTGMYATDIKLSATGKAVEVPAFKVQQIAQLRGTLDDIAKERGGRKAIAEVTGKDGGPISFTLSFDRLAIEGDSDDQL